MMSELLKIVEFTKKNVAAEKVAVARLSLMVGQDVTKITPDMPADTAKIEKFKKAAETITGKKYS